MTELGELRKHYRDIIDRRVEVVAVSVDPRDVSEKLRRKLDLPIRFLSDERGTLMDALHVRHRNGTPPSFITHRATDGRDLFLSTTFLLDEEGVIRWVYRPDTYRVRAPAREVLRAIDALP
ncbi:MAG: peroxiredoxin family protein [Deltaproteobacteria bacterium]|nr:MAG: peroxiredoxin family protein [Deltaproteobacteria bacterium]